MFKSLGALIGGIFVGAVAVELIRRKCPNALDKLCAKTRKITSGAKEAFWKGYENAKQPRKAAASTR